MESKLTLTGSWSTPTVHPVLVQAREVLLDGLEQFGTQLPAVTVIGAQAVYEWTKDRDDIPMTLTYDGDLCVDPSRIAATVDVHASMRSAGFEAPTARPGIWHHIGFGQEKIGFDLLVPEALAGPGRRGARVAGQTKQTFGRAKGLELVLLDRHERTIESLGDAGRTMTVHVAGPTAIMCAKAYKLTDRLDDRSRGSKDRVKPKDAADVWRLMHVIDPQVAHSIFMRGCSDPNLGPAIAEGIRRLTGLFSDGGDGTLLAQEALAAEVDRNHTTETISAWITSFSKT